MNGQNSHLEEAVNRYSSITALVAFLVEYDHFHPNSLSWVVEMLLRRHYGQEFHYVDNPEIEAKINASSRDIRDFLMYRGVV